MFTDPKRPQKIIFYQHKTAPEDQSDFFQLISMLFGILSFILKVMISSYFRLNGLFGLA